MSFYYDPSNQKMEIYPMPKVGDTFTIDIEVPESWLRSMLRKIGLVRSPKKLIRRVFSVNQEYTHSGTMQFPSGEYENWR